MALEWIKSYKKLERDPKTLHFKALMRWSQSETVGFLHRFWWWADDVAPDGVVTSLCLPGVVGGALGYSPAIGDKAVEKMKEAGWLDCLPSGEVAIHNHDKYRASTKTTQDATRERVRRHREKKRRDRNGDVTRYGNGVTPLDEEEETDQETTCVCENGDSSAGVFEGQFDPRRPGILDSWKERRRGAGLDTAITQRDKTTASSVLLALDAGDYTMEQLLKAMDNLMADPEWRHRYSFHGFVDDLGRWLNRKKEDDNPNPRRHPSRPNEGQATPGDFEEVRTGDML